MLQTLFDTMTQCLLIVSTGKVVYILFVLVSYQYMVSNLSQCLLSSSEVSNKVSLLCHDDEDDDEDDTETLLAELE